MFDNVAFIVFNYDRCLEHFLSNALQLVYQISINDAQSILSACRIIHPYGKVAPLFGNGAVPFGGSDGFDHDCAALSTNVKIFTEQMSDRKSKDDIHEEIASAEQIFISRVRISRHKLATAKTSQTSESQARIRDSLGYVQSRYRGCAATTRSYVRGFYLRGASLNADIRLKVRCSF